MNIQLNKGLLIQKVVDEIVILEPDSGDYFTLNETGAMMIELLQQGRTLSEIKSELTQEFNVSSEEVEQDFKQLLINLEKHGLAHNNDA